MNRLFKLSLLGSFVVASLLLSGCGAKITADQQAKLEETRVSAEKSEKDLSSKKKERLELEEQVGEGANE